jgi:hypothetical protein
MKLFIRAVVTGFGLALGSALFKEARERLGWREPPEDDDKKQEKVNAQDGATDPALRMS